MGFRKAKPQQAALKIAIYGRAGTGKSFTALLVAEGLAKHTGKRVAYVDTEHGTDFYAQAVAERSVHPEAFDFDALYTRSLSEASKEIRALDPKDYGVVVIDQITTFWEAAKAAYRGKRTSKGDIPIHAWGPIKRPYKDLERWLMNSPLHVVICGREGVEVENDGGEIVVVGAKMKAEGETPNEPNVLLRMVPDRDESGAYVYRALAEKDRSGVLAGRFIEWPTFDNVAAPLLGLLGDEQAKMDTVDEAAAVDAETMSADDEERDRFSMETLEDYKARFQLAKTGEEVEALAKEITSELKKKMLPADVAELRKLYHEASTRVPAPAKPTEKPKSGKKKSSTLPEKIRAKAEELSLSDADLGAIGMQVTGYARTVDEYSENQLKALLKALEAHAARAAAQ